MVNAVTFAQLYSEARGQLPSAFEAEQLFCHVTGWHRHDLPQMGGQAVPDALVQRLQGLCRRRTRGEPLQYLLGEWEFYGLPFFVGEGVLIPRADTETLVDAALAKAKSMGEGSLRILDLCSGSGAVAVALAHHLPKAHVTAVELSETAFCYLRRNIAANRVAVEAVRADLYRYVPEDSFDIITANPPYIPSGELPALQQEVRLEPATALDGGEDGLAFYRGIARGYHPHLKPGGLLAVEIGMGQAPAVAEIFTRFAYRDLEEHQDLNGVVRVLSGFR